MAIIELAGIKRHYTVGDIVVKAPPGRASRPS